MPLQRKVLQTLCFFRFQLQLLRLLPRLSVHVQDRTLLSQGQTGAVDNRAQRL